MALDVRGKEEMSYRFGAVFLLTSIILSLCAAPALGIAFSVSSAGGVGTSLSLALDDPSYYVGRCSIIDGRIIDEDEAGGYGENIYQKLISSRDCSVSNAVISSGAFSSSASAMASPNCALASLSSRMDGDEGYLSSISSTDADFRIVAASFNGRGGDIDARLISSASHGADIEGSISAAGINGIGAGLLSKDTAVSINGLYPSSDGELGDFSIISARLDGARGPSRTPSRGNTVKSTNYRNDPRSYELAGWRWENNPSLIFYLSTDSQFKGESLKVADVSKAIANAASTWDAATSQKLFSGSVYAASSGLGVDKGDGMNVVGWIPISSGALAYSRTYYSYSTVPGADGNDYFTAVESDICFNTGYKWVTSNTARSYPQVYAFDVQTVALHELGHTYGLGDLYTLQDTDLRKKDSYQIMNSYDNKQRTLGAGDKAGILKLYG